MDGLSTFNGHFIPECPEVRENKPNLDLLKWSKEAKRHEENAIVGELIEDLTDEEFIKIKSKLEGKIHEAIRYESKTTLRPAEDCIVQKLSHVKV